MIRALFAFVLLLSAAQFGQAGNVVQYMENGVPKATEIPRYTISVSKGTFGAAQGGTYYIYVYENGFQDPEFARAFINPTSGQMTLFAQNSGTVIPALGTATPWNTSSGQGYLTEGGTVNVEIRVVKDGVVQFVQPVGSYTGVRQPWSSNVAVGTIWKDEAHQVELSGFNDCPPRDNVKFHLDYTIGGTGEYVIAIKIDGQNRAAVAGSYDGLGGPPLEKTDNFGPFETPGEFTWQVTANGEVVASGAVACQEEIPLDTINVFFDYLIKPPEKPAPDPEAKPDPDKPQPPPSNENPNPEGPKPGTAPPVVKPDVPGLPVGDPGHDMYRAIVAGLGTMNSGEFPGAPYTSGLADYDSEMAKRGRLDEIEDKLKGLVTQQGEIKDKLGALNVADSAMEDILPKDIGQLQVWDYASFTLPTGQQIAISLNFAPFLDIIAKIRQIFLLFVNIWFVWACGKEIFNAL